jgi:hypothetical protein
MRSASRIAAFLRARICAARHPRHAQPQMKAANAMLPARSVVVKPYLPEGLARNRDSGLETLFELLMLPAINTAVRTPKTIVATAHLVTLSPIQIAHDPPVS